MICVVAAVLAASGFMSAQQPATRPAPPVEALQLRVRDGRELAFTIIGAPGCAVRVALALNVDPRTGSLLDTDQLFLLTRDVPGLAGTLPGNGELRLVLPIPEAGRRSLPDACFAQAGITLPTGGYAGFSAPVRVSLLGAASQQGQLILGGLATFVAALLAVLAASPLTRRRAGQAMLFGALVGVPVALVMLKGAALWSMPEGSATLTAPGSVTAVAWLRLLATLVGGLGIVSRVLDGTLPRRARLAFAWPAGVCCAAGIEALVGIAGVPSTMAIAAAVTLPALACVRRRDFAHMLPGSGVSAVLMVFLSLVIPAAIAGPGWLDVGTTAGDFVARTPALFIGSVVALIAGLATTGPAAIAALLGAAACALAPQMLTATRTLDGIAPAACGLALGGVLCVAGVQRRSLVCVLAAGFAWGAVAQTGTDIALVAAAAALITVLVGPWRVALLAGLITGAGIACLPIALAAWLNRTPLPCALPTGWDPARVPALLSLFSQDVAACALGAAVVLLGGAALVKLWRGGDPAGRAALGCSLAATAAFAVVLHTLLSSPLNLGTVVAEAGPSSLALIWPFAAAMLVIAAIPSDLWRPNFIPPPPVVAAAAAASAAAPS